MKRKRYEEKVRHDQISIDLDGKTYSGNRTITGTRRLYQTIEYNGRYESDSHSYEPYETTSMMSIARLILSELVKKSIED